MKNLISIVAFVIVLPGSLAAAQAHEPSKEQDRQASAVPQLRESRTQLEAAIETLIVTSRKLPQLETEMIKIDRLAVEKDHKKAIGAAIQIAAPVRKDLNVLRQSSDKALSQVRQANERLYAALLAVQKPSVPEPSALRRYDTALESSIATSLAAASLTLAGLLLGLGMPLLLSKAKVSSSQGADKLTTDFRLSIGSAATNVLLAFGFFAIAILENVTLDPSDWSFLRQISADFGLWVDVSTETSALTIGVALLVRGGAQLRSGVRYLAGVKGLASANI